jgi:hemoglobin
VSDQPPTTGETTGTTTGDTAAEETTVYDVVGGRPFFDELVERFYAGVAGDPVLRPLYPEDLTASKAHLAGFLAQYWGGGTAQYSDARGHPRLRMRHVPFVIGRAERDAWYRHMADAVHAAGLPDDLEARMLEYFEMAANHLINAPVEPPAGRATIPVEPSS